MVLYINQLMNSDEKTCVSHNSCLPSFLQRPDFHGLYVTTNEGLRVPYFSNLSCLCTVGLVRYILAVSNFHYNKLKAYKL